MAQQGQRHRRLATARGRRGYEEAGRGGGHGEQLCRGAAVLPLTQLRRGERVSLFPLPSVGEGCEALARSKTELRRSWVRGKRPQAANVTPSPAARKRNMMNSQ